MSSPFQTASEIKSWNLDSSVWVSLKPMLLNE